MYVYREDADSRWSKTTVAKKDGVMESHLAGDAILWDGAAVSEQEFAGRLRSHEAERKRAEDRILEEARRAEAAKAQAAEASLAETREAMMTQRDPFDRANGWWMAGGIVGAVALIDVTGGYLWSLVFMATCWVIGMTRK